MITFIALKKEKLEVRNDKNSEATIYDIVETKKEDVERKRKNQQCFIYKAEGKYFCTEELPERVLSKVSTFVLGHKCATCRRLSAASDERGGCWKVRDGLDSKKIEKYSFITEGYEIRYKNSEMEFIVLNCTHYQKVEDTSKKYSSEERRKLNNNLYQFINPDYSEEKNSNENEKKREVIRVGVKK